MKDANGKVLNVGDDIKFSVNTYRPLDIRVIVALFKSSDVKDYVVYEKFHHSDNSVLLTTCYCKDVIKIHKPVVVTRYANVGFQTLWDSPSPHTKYKITYEKSGDEINTDSVVVTEYREGD